MREIFIDMLQGSNNTITVTENDNLTETYKLILMKNRIRINLTNKKVKFVFVKPNSNHGDIFDEMNISNPTEGEVELPITNQISKENGMYSCGLAIYNNEGYLEHTGIFNLYVKENLFEKVSNELIEHNTYKKLTSLLNKASDINNKLITNTGEANKVNNAAINLRNALEGEVNKANQVNDTLSKTKNDAVDKNTTLNNSLEEAKKLLTEVGKYNLDNYMRKVDIPSDRDCNSFKEINVFCVFDTGAGDFKNTPEGSLPEGSCRVFIIINRGFTTTRFQQEFINLYPQDRVTRYVRNFNADGNGIWGNWYKVYDEANKPTPNDIGTYTKQEIDNKDTTTLNSAKSYADSNFLTKAPIKLGKQDFNLITDAGVYFLVGENHLNRPPTLAEGKGGSLFVEHFKGGAGNNETIIQRFIDEVTGQISTRVKLYATDTWTSWNTVYSTAHNPTPEDIGALGKTATATNSDKLFGYGKYIGTNQGGTFGIPVVGSDGVMEIGYIIDMHLPTSSKDYDARLQLNGDGSRLSFNHNVIYTDGNKPSPAELKTFGGYGYYGAGTDLNNLLENGAYEINEISKCTNGIQGVYDWGTLVVFNSKRIPQNDGQRITQIYYPHIIRDGIRIPYMRVKDNVNWTEWAPVTKGFSWNDLVGKPSSFPPSGHNHDDLYFRKGKWNTNGEQDLLVHGKRALVGTLEGDLFLGYGGDFTALYFGWNKIYHQGFKPTPADIGASPSDHSHDDRYLKKEVGATNESFRFRTKFLEFGVDDSKLGEIGVGPNDTYIHNAKSNKYLALKDDGRLLYSNKEVCDRGHFTGDPGLNGYQMFPSGLLVQWGYIDMGKDTTKLVNFPKSFKDNNYNLQVSVYGGPGRVPAVKTYTAKNNNFHIQCEAGFSVYWEAKGSV